MQSLAAVVERLLPALLAASIVIVVAGIAAHTGALPLYWSRLALGDLLAFLGGATALALVLRFLVPGRAPLALLAALVLYLVPGLGLLPTAAALLFAAASWCWGQWLLAALFPASAPAFGLTRPLCVGLALQSLWLGLLLHAPLNYRALHVALQVLPCLGFLRSSTLRAGACALHRRLQAAAAGVDGIPYGVLAAGLVLLGAVARLAFLPTLSADDLALHLRLWAELTQYHEARFDVTEQVWAAAPFAVDLMHGVISLVAGADARGALNVLLMALLGRQLWAILGHLGLVPAGRVMALALFASTPIAGFLLATLQTELFVALLATAGVRLLLELEPRWFDATLAALCAVAALCVAAKLPGAVLAAIFVLTAAALAWPLRLADLRRHGDARLALFGACLLALAALALHPYVNAWLLTGNPVFPLYNAVFRSPLYDTTTNFGDERWLHGFSLASYWNLFFATSRHYEARDFSAGFQYLALLPLALPLLWTRVPARTALVLLVPLAGFGTIMFAQTQYWRYLFPVLPLASAVIGALWLARTPLLRLAVLGAAGLCLALNLFFHAGVSWELDMPVGMAYTAAGRAQLTAWYVPEKTLTAWVNANAPGSRVLYPDTNPYGADLLGEPAYVNWYAPRREASANALRTLDEIYPFLAAEGIDYVVWSTAAGTTSGSGKALIGAWLAREAQVVASAGDFALYRVPEEAPWRPVFTATGLAVDAAPLAVFAGATEGLPRFRLDSRFTCSGEGFIEVAIVWDNGAPWERAVPCIDGPGRHREVVEIPAAATRGELSLRARDATARIESLALEIR